MPPIGAAEAGAAIIHLHARNPKDGRPRSESRGVSPDSCRASSARSDCVINITTGGAPAMTLEERLKPCAVFKPEVASLNMGSMNFGLFQMLKRYKTLKYDWEHTLLEGSRDRVFKNTFKDIEYILTTCAENGTRFEFECYDIGHLYTLAHFVDRGLIKPPFFVQSVFGILGGIGAHPEDVAHMKRTADRLFGNDLHWSVLGGGRSQMEVARCPPRWAATCASASRTRCGTGRAVSPSRTRTRCGACAGSSRGLGREIATPDDAREMLELKGGDSRRVLARASTRISGTRSAGRLGCTTQSDPRSSLAKSAPPRAGRRRDGRRRIRALLRGSADGRRCERQELALPRPELRRRVYGGERRRDVRARPIKPTSTWCSRPIATRRSSAEAGTQRVETAGYALLIVPPGREPHHVAERRTRRSSLHDALARSRSQVRERGILRAPASEHSAARGLARAAGRLQGPASTRSTCRKRRAASAASIAARR